MKTKNVTCEDESGVERRETETPPRKKLKQARLPFQILSPGLESPSPTLKNSNKRKLSDTSEDVKIVKIVRPNDSEKLIEAKENVCSPLVGPDSGGKTSSSNGRIEVENNAKKSSVVQCESGGESSMKDTEVNCETDKLSISSSPKQEKSEEQRSNLSADELDLKVLSDTEDNVIKGEFCDNSKLDPVERCSDVQNEIIQYTNEKLRSPSVESDQSAGTLESSVVLDAKNSDDQEPCKNTEFKESSVLDSLSDAKNSDKQEPCTDSKFKENSVLDAKNSDDQEPCKNTEFKESSVLDSLSDAKNSDNQESCTNSESKVSAPKVSEIFIPNGLRASKKNSKSEVDLIHLEEVLQDSHTPKKVLHLEQAVDNVIHQEHTPSSDTKIQKQVSPCSVSDSTPKLRKLTPKQLQKQLESAKKREEKERLRQEREKKKAEEKEEREKKRAEEKEEKLKQKLEKEEQRKKEKEEKDELKKKEKEEKEELKKKEKEEKERKKLVELEMRNEEKKAKDEEKRKKEGKLQAEVAAFTSFFVPKKSECKPPEEPKVKVEENFMPFEVKIDMRLAPSSRSKLTKDLRDSLDYCMKIQSENNLYLKQLKNKMFTPQSSPCTWTLNDFKNEVVILEEDEISASVTDNVIESYPTDDQLPRPKLLQFWENRRPPYWGTWRKKSQCIGPKQPFNKDEKLFDYEVDSDDEWEEEEPGESLHGSDDEKESEDEYEVDNDFFVPHGYLSDEENVGQDDEEQSPEMLKTKLKLLELEFEEEMKQKTERIKPRLIGCIWIDSKTADSVGAQLLKLLSPYQAVYQDGPIVTSPVDPVGSTSLSGSPESKSQTQSPTTPFLKKRKFPEEAIPALIKLIHGNVNKREFLVREFLAYWRKEQQKSLDELPERPVEGTIPAPSPGDIFKRSVTNKIKELATWIACPDDGPMSGRMCWYVPQETRSARELADITLPNTLWNYTFKPKRRESEGLVSSITPSSGNESTPKQLITKFTKVMTEVERKKQFNTAVPMTEVIDKSGDKNLLGNDTSHRKLVFNSCNKGSTPKTGVPYKKVPILMSVPKGHEMPKGHSNSLMKFMKSPNCASSEEMKSVPNTPKCHQDVKTRKAEDEECIVLSD